ncbi:twitching mobility protein PilT [Clostridium aceticum]|uniref:Twitching mobility protein PilT n=1 Tax=Clostridium aceticum TaxID=84022 RepID=A0A0D8ICT3_9CLOT|nr:type IV pilus twitching motility protein PilT [Clostridium aceticum]AKL95271.1 twitching mobility protein PilT [Clostridium aceticum]KJF28120.1 twitching motility protein PilT [Clostridium aceticum]
MDIIQLLTKAVKAKASDIHITVASPPMIRVNGKLIKMEDNKLTPEDTKNIVQQMMTPDQVLSFKEKGELDFSYSNAGLGRFRVNAYKQRGSYSMAIRVVTFKVPTIEELNLPPVITELSKKQRGLILVTGPTGSGKSTTLAAMINYMNESRNDHILTLEDPIEYLHKHNKSVVNQREIGNDSYSFANALRSALRQDPDVILVGEMRDLETISIAVTAAETGHLVLSTLHTIGAAKTIDRIIDVFPPHQQQQIKVQLSSVLEGVISQQLLPKADESGRAAAFEIMVTNPAVRNLIREGKTHQMQTVIQTGSKLGMKTMDASLMELYRSRTITRETLQKYAVDIDMLTRQMGI